MSERASDPASTERDRLARGLRETRRHSAVKG